MGVIVFLGGFSAATAMIVVDSLALSKMISNDIVLPVLLRGAPRCRRVLDESGLDPPRHPRRGGARRGVGPHRGRSVPARGDGAPLVHRRHAVRARRLPGTLLAARESAGRLRRHLGRLRHVVLHADRSDAREGGRSAAPELLERAPSGWSSAPAHRAPRAGRARHAQRTGCSGRSSSTSAPTCSSRCARTQDADERSQAAAFVGVAEAEPARVPAILSVPEIERLHSPVRPRGGGGRDPARGARRP